MTFHARTRTWTCPDFKWLVLRVFGVPSSCVSAVKSRSVRRPRMAFVLPVVHFLPGSEPQNCFGRLR